MRLGILINPAAGRRSAARLEHLVADFCARQSLEVDLVVLQGSDRLEQLVHRLLPGVDAIGVVGGDGSLNGVVNGVMTSARPGTPLAFFPAGRGKDVARTLPSWPPATLEKLDWCSSTQVDVGTIISGDGTRHFLNEMSIGIGALAARAATSLPRTLGTTSYLVGTAWALVQGRPFSATLTLDGGHDVELRRCHHITIANGRYFGGGLQIAPAADPTDGLLEVIAVADVNASTIARGLPRLFRATHLEHPAVRHWRSASVHIETSRPVLVESDGEVWTTTPLTVTIEKQALTWLEPA